MTLHPDWMATMPEWMALGPALVLGLTAMLLFVVDSIDPDSHDRNLLAGSALIGSVTAMALSAWYLAAGTGQPSKGGPIELLDGALVVDGLSLFFAFIFAAVTALVVIASYDYLRDHAYQAEYYSLVVLAATGMTFMASANSLAVAFVSLELASLPSYALVAFLKKDKGSVEAGLKYFLIGALSSAIFAYGISLVYGATGAFALPAIADAVATTPTVGLLGVGVVMTLGGFLFKTASVPFHFWAPEAYEGAPAPVSAFLSSASKAAGFALAFRVFVVAFPLDAMQSVGVDWAYAAAVVAVLTMTLGNFAAATQEEVKRMLAYSSVGHAGYAMIGLAALAGGNDVQVLGASMTHLLVYGFMNTGAFLFVGLVEYWGLGRTFEDYNGLAKRAPAACVAMTIFMFSLAGLPPFGGFLSKYYLFMGAVGAGLWWLAAVGAINSALSLFYYSRVVKALWIEEPQGGVAADGGVDERPTGLYIAVIVAGLLTVLALPAFGLGYETAQSAAETLLG
jgi:NADH-quinone oxidoreductase subunit N